MSFRPLVEGFDTLVRAGALHSAFSARVLEGVAHARTAQDFVTWDLFLDMLDQARAFLGDAAYAGAFDHFEGDRPEVAAFGAPGVSVQTFCRAMFDAYGGGSFPGFSNTHRELPDGSVELRLWVPEDFRDTTSFFLACVSVNRQRPCWIGLPPAQVDYEIVPHRLRLRLIFDPAARPPSPRFLEPQRTEAFAEILRVMSQNFARAIERVQALPTPEVRLAALEREWSLTPRQAEVLRCICRGLSNQEIAQELGCAKKTVELHVTEVLRKSGLDSRAQLVSRFAEPG